MSHPLYDDPEYVNAIKSRNEAWNQINFWKNLEFIALQIISEKERDFLESQLAQNPSLNENP